MGFNYCNEKGGCTGSRRQFVSGSLFSFHRTIFPKEVVVATGFGATTWTQLVATGFGATTWTQRHQMSSVQVKEEAASEE